MATENRCCNPEMRTSKKPSATPECVEKKRRGGEGMEEKGREEKGR